MIFCYAHTSVSYSVTLKEVSPAADRNRDLHTARYYHREEKKERDGERERKRERAVWIAVFINWVFRSLTRVWPVMCVQKTLVEQMNG